MAQFRKHSKYGYCLYIPCNSPATGSVTPASASASASASATASASAPTGAPPVAAPKPPAPPASATATGSASTGLAAAPPASSTGLAATPPASSTASASASGAGSKKKQKIKKKANSSIHKAKKLTEQFVLLFMKKFYDKIQLPNNLKIISGGDTGSNAKVYKYTQEDNNYIIKVFTENSELKLDHVITEVKIYNYLNALRILKVCNHIVLHNDCAIYQDKDNKKTLLMLNETLTKDEEVVSLRDFIRIHVANNNITYMEKILPTLLFQLMYTLECLVRAKVKHNDLHLGNVLVFIDNTNIITNPHEFEDSKLKYDKYVVTSRIKADYFGPDIESYKTLYASNREKQNIDQDTITYYVPDYGFKIKVFDFDRSCVYDKDNKSIIFNDNFYNTKFTNEYDNYMYSMIESEPKSYYHNNIPFEYIDLYTVFKYILHDISKYGISTPMSIYYNYNYISIQIFSATINIIDSYFDYEYYRNFPTFFKKKTVYELLTYIFGNTTDSNYSIFNFTKLVPDKTKIHNTFKIANITKIWGKTDGIDPQPLLSEPQITTYKTIMSRVEKTLKKRNKSNYPPVSQMVNMEARDFKNTGKSVSSNIDLRLNSNTSDTASSNNSNNSSNA